MRGGDIDSIDRQATLTGRSPHARGRHRDGVPAATGLRSIPACAGETGNRVPWPGAIRVDPRMRGGDSMVSYEPFVMAGRSPHARGRPSASMRPYSSIGSIPACAGETIRPDSPDHYTKVDPRIRGVDGLVGLPVIRVEGRSPHARGRPPPVRRSTHQLGSIPACAGETQESPPIRG